MVRTAWFRRAASYGITAMMAGFGFTGIVSAQSITNTGPRSINTISSSSNSNCTVTNNNNVSATSSNNQTANTGNASSDGNTIAGLSWTGWSALDPSVAQADGQSYASWQNGTTNWITQRASGDGWNSNSDNLSWTPSGSDWTSMDPVSWQANGQSFGNWYNAVESYLNNNSSAWILSWPADDTGSGSFGTSTGSATNNYNADFSININNGARAAAGTNSCGQSNFTPPPATGGMGGGGSWSAPVSSIASAGYTPHYSGSGSGSGTGYGGGSSYSAPKSQPSAPSAPAQASQAPTAPAGPTGGSGAGAPVSSGASISTTGPGSTNTISSSSNSNYQVTNNNNVSTSSYNNQIASTGSSTSSGNTVAGGGGTGDASNGNTSGTGVGISN